MANEELVLSLLQKIQSEMATKSDIASVRSEMATKKDLDAIKKDVAELRGEQVSMFAFLQENTVTKRDLEEAKSEMMTHVDGLAAYNQKFDQELLMIRNRQDRLEARMA